MDVTCLQKTERERGPEKKKKKGMQKKDTKNTLQRKAKKRARWLTFRKKETKEKTATEPEGGSECECLELNRERNERHFFLAKATKRSGGDGVGRGNRQANFSSVQDFAAHTSFGGRGANGGGGRTASNRAGE